MNCPNCGAPVDPGQKFCTSCGAGLPQSAPVTAPSAAGRTDPIPAQVRPLSPWAYFGLSLLFAIPLVGFICLIVFSFDDSNLNRRNYARSFWCALLVGLVVIIALFALLSATGGMEYLEDYYSSLY